MALLASKRVRKNFTSQIFGNGATGHHPLVICFAKNNVLLPGQYASFLGRDFTHHDYLNTTINWTSYDGAGGANRQYFLGFCAVPVGSNRNFYSDENGCYFNGPLPITVVSEGTIGSVFILTSGRIYSTIAFGVSVGTILAPNTNQGIGANYVAIGEGAASSVVSTNLVEGSSTGFNGSNYVYRPAGAQYDIECYGYNKMLMVSDSFGVNNGSIFDVSSTQISNSSTTFLNSIKLKVSEVW
ncbi:MAG: hypothetical protein ACKOXF_10130 [Chitinophagaceae bacterium]